MKQYIIHYEVDTGYDYCRDTAMVKADSENDAVEKLKEYIPDTGYEHEVSKVFFVKEFTGDIFSGRFRPKKK